MHTTDEVPSRTVYIKYLESAPSWHEMVETFCDEHLLHVCYAPMDPIFDGNEDECVEWHLYAQFANPVKPSRFIDAFENQPMDVKPTVQACKHDFMSLDTYRAEYPRWSHLTPAHFVNNFSG